MTYDVAIIGAGISGASIARELTKYKLSVCIIEKENDVSCGTSKANSGIIHAGYDPEPDTLMAPLNIRGCELYPTLAEELHFDFKPIGSLVVGFSEEDDVKLQTLLERGKKNGVKELRIVQQEELRKMEPNIAEEAYSALHAPTAAIISPYQTTWAIAENAVQNGADIFLEHEVHSIEKGEKTFKIITGSRTFETRYLVNAAGLFADKISAMVGARDFVIMPRRGEYCLLDNNCKDFVNTVLFQIPHAFGKGVLVTPTVDENIIVGPSAGDDEDKNFVGTSRKGQAAIIEVGEKSTPNIPRRHIINSFAGNRAIAYNADETPVGDFIIEEDATIKGFINVAGISSPGLTAAPAIGEYVTELLQKAGLELKPNGDFIKIRKGIENFHKADLNRKERLIEKNPLYGRIICRCEMITEAEIVLAINSPIGARDLDGVKRRTRSGMGRCQGGFCSPRVTEIISRERNIPMINVTKNGGNSYILHSKSR